MKKVLFAVASLVLGYGTFAQTIVSTEVQKRNVVIEEYTGIGCSYCPLGHQNVQSYANQHEGRVVAINIHQGGYASGYKPNFTTQYGDALASQCEIGGYPAGTLNRTGSSATALIQNVGPSGTGWTGSANQILNQDSPVNVAATASIDATTRKMTVKVEVYYTSAVTADENRLNVVLLQNNVEGDQANYGNYNSEYIISSSGNMTRYRHMHMLREMITGTWGEAIATANESGVIPAGTFVEKEYTYDIPASYKDYSYGSNTNVDAVMGEFELAVFLTEGQSANAKVKAPNIYTGIKVEPEYTNVTGLGASVKSVAFEQEFGCKDLSKVFVSFHNDAGDALTSVTFQYTNTATNDVKTYTWTTTEGIGTYQNSPKIAFDEPITTLTGATSTIEVRITELNGQPYEDNNPKTATFAKPKINEGKGAPHLILRTDNKASEISWFVYNDNGDVIEQGGNYSNGTTVRDTIQLWRINTPGCYTFEIKDEGGDGASNGRYLVVDANGTTLTYNSKGDWGASEKKDFKISDIVGLNEADGNIFQAVVYPNPAKDMVTLSVNVNDADAATISVLDLMGREVLNMGTQNLKSGENQININTSNLENGMYYIRVVTDNGITTNKLSITK